jgi:hypothetical protein
MKPSTKRIVLRVVHLVAVIPVLGYVYSVVAEAAEIPAVHRGCLRGPPS